MAAAPDQYWDVYNMAEPTSVSSHSTLHRASMDNSQTAYVIELVQTNVESNYASFAILAFLVYDTGIETI